MRLLALNIGNTTLSGGVFSGSRLISRFRIPRTLPAAALAEKLGRLLRGRIDLTVVCSVVPALTPRVSSLLNRRLGTMPLVLDSRADHGLSIGYRRPSQLGTDRLAAALGAQARHPGKNLIIVDCGTATTVTAVGASGRLFGGAIIPGVALWAEALARRTAQLPLVSPRASVKALGRSPKEAIASGLHHGHAGAIAQLVGRVAREAFGDETYLVLGTGGNAARFVREKLFTRLEPDLILHGLRAFAAGIHDHV